MISEISYLEAPVKEVALAFLFTLASFGLIRTALARWRRESRKLFSCAVLEAAITISGLREPPSLLHPQASASFDHSRIFS